MTMGAIKAINSNISETIVTNSYFDVHHNAIARYITTISFMRFHPLVTRLWLLTNTFDDIGIS